MAIRVVLNLDERASIVSSTAETSVENPGVISFMYKPDNILVREDSSFILNDPN